MKKNYHSEIVDQLVETLYVLDQDSFALKLPILQNSSLGQHFRHILEFYLCLMDAKISGTVNYDNRKRDLILETDISYAIRVAKNLLTHIESLNINDSLQLENPSRQIIQSNFSRELFYLTEHTIHHFALIKIGVTVAFPQYTLPENFGVAESTIKYKKLVSSN